MEPYVAWLVLGFALVIVEMLTGTFYLLMLGVACFGAGAAAYFSQGFPLQVVVFAVISAIGVWCVHSYRLANRQAQMKPIDAGMPAKFEGWTDQAAGRARVRYRDASWDARLDARTDVQPGATLYVLSVDGNTVHVDTRPPD